MKVSVITLAVRFALQRMEREGRIAYSDGLDAAYRTGRYAGSKSTPRCPYEDGTVESVHWRGGFAEGTDDLIALRSGDITKWGQLPSGTI